MRMIERYLAPYVKDFLSDRMVFVGGPRQVGKTTLCLSFLKESNIESPAYLNWDDLRAKALLKAGDLPVDESMICIDEIHKYKNWRSLLKGFFDTKRNRQKFIVTGSARLDHYRRGGDSLMGRYRYLRLHPLSLGELRSFSIETTEELLSKGGFPEPFFSSRENFRKLWRRERVYRIVNDDIRNLERVHEFNSIELLAENLPTRIASPLSINNLANDLEVHHATIKNWLSILDNVYYSYRISCYGPPKIRAVKKEQKLYLWDWSVITERGIRFENMVASQLLKYCHLLEDTEGDKMELRFVRDTDKREIDFVVLKEGKPIFAVECKTGERSLSPHINYFKMRTPIPHFYQVHLGTRHTQIDDKCTILPFWRFCKDLGMP